MNVSVVFAEAPGICQTLEGEVRYDAGDALLTGTRGETWPVGRPRFDSTYEASASTPPGADGIYRKRPLLIKGRRLAETTTVHLSNGRGSLTGNPGDWLVQYGEGDFAIVSSDIFAETYDLIDEPAGGPAPADR